MNWDVWPLHGAVARWFLALPWWAQLLVAWPFAAVATAWLWHRFKRRSFDQAAEEAIRVARGQCDRDDCACKAVSP